MSRGNLLESVVKQGLNSGHMERLKSLAFKRVIKRGITKRKE